MTLLLCVELALHLRAWCLPPRPGASRGSPRSFLNSLLGPLGYLVHSAFVSITTGTIPRQDPEQRGARRFSQMSLELTVPGEGMPCDRCLMSLSKRPHLGLGWEVFSCGWHFCVNIT